jgi:hypothetical protein
LAKAAQSFPGTELSGTRHLRAVWEQSCLGQGSSGLYGGRVVWDKEAQGCTGVELSGTKQLKSCPWTDLTGKSYPRVVQDTLYVLGQCLLIVGRDRVVKGYDCPGHRQKVWERAVKERDFWDRNVKRYDLLGQKYLTEFSKAKLGNIQKGIPLKNNAIRKKLWILLFYSGLEKYNGQEGYGQPLQRSPLLQYLQVSPPVLYCLLCRVMVNL